MSFSQSTLQSIEYFENEGPVHRSVKSTKLRSLMSENITTAYSLLAPVLNSPEIGDKPCLGVRERLADGKFGNYTWKSYAQVNKEANSFAAALKSLGIKKNDNVGVYAKNRPEWVYSLLACLHQNYTIVPLYETLGPSAVSFIINHAEIEVVVSSGENLVKLLSALPECPTLKYIISMDSFTENDLVHANKAGIKLLSFKELQKKVTDTVEPVHTSPNDMLTILYTSGTTGVPKGVMLTNSNIMASLTAINDSDFRLSSDDIHLSYLPLAHIFDFTVVINMLSLGGKIGFWRGAVEGLIEDIQCLSPTVLIGAPRVFNRIHDKIKATINSGSFIKKSLFNYAYQQKSQQIQRGEGNSSMWDSIVFSKIAQLLGGRVRMIVSGSAPLSASVQDFLRVCFCCPIMQVYGLTETAALTFSDINDFTSGHVGAPVVSSEIKLVDVPEMGYTSSNFPQQGEVCSRGPNHFKGYYKMPEKTSEAIDREGWFHTGDIGEWLPNGTLKIIDRKKNIFKLAQGEYVAAEYLETVYLRCPFTMQIFVYGDSFQSSLVAIVVPDPETIIPWAQKHGIKEDMAQLCYDPRIKQLIFDSLMKVANEAKMKGFEKVSNIYLEPTPWTVENGFLTPTMKTKRAELGKNYKEIIDKLYSAPLMSKAKL